MRLLCLFNKKCFASECCEGSALRGVARAWMLLLVVHSLRVGVARSSGCRGRDHRRTATGSPTIHALNTTACAIESLTSSWWCSSMGDLRETARNRRRVCSHQPAIAANSRDEPESSSVLSPPHLYRLSSVINLAIVGSVTRCVKCADKSRWNVAWTLRCRLRRASDWERVSS